MQELERRNSWLAGARYPTLQQLRQEPFYQTTPQVNLNPAAQNLFGNFFSRNAAANNAWRYPNPQPQRVPLASYGNQAMVVPAAQQQAARLYNENVQPIIDNYVTPQLIQNALLTTAAGKTLGGAVNQWGYPLAITAAAKFGTPAVNAVNAVANSPLGRWGAKLIDAIF